MNFKQWKSEVVRHCRKHGIVLNARDIELMDYWRDGYTIEQTANLFGEQ